MKIEVKKIYRGNISIRDYVVAHAQEKGCGIEVYYKNKVMTIPYEQLQTGKVNSEPLESHFSKSTYRLIDYKWSPDEQESRLF